MPKRTFTLEEARQMLPEIRQLLSDANAELDHHLESVRIAQEKYDQAEQKMSTLITDASDPDSLNQLRDCRENFQTAIQRLSEEQRLFVHRLGEWIDRVSSRGVIIRNFREGLIDFPAEQNGFPYFLCWKMDEKDITHWHLTADGFIGRKPLVTLSEYC